MDKSPFGFHEGEALHKLAGYYPRILDVLLENVQNSLDKNGKNVAISINQKSRNISIRDDGDGVSQAEFERALTSVSTSIKKKDKLGRFGLGLISPLGKCDRFIFTSTPKRDSRDFLEWTFISEDLRAQSKIAGIPMKTRPDLVFSRESRANSRGTTFVPWRTEVRIEKYTGDSQINRVTIQSLKDGILDRFGATMRRNNACIFVTIVNENGDRDTQEIRAKEFEGIKLDEVNYQEKGVGRTSFNIFLAKPVGKVRKGKVLIGESGNDFRIDFGTFVRSLPEVCQLSDEVVSALKSGFFEGEIHNSGIRLHASRRSFENDDSLVGFCVTIERWFEEYGSGHFAEAQEQRREERYQQYGMKSMSVFEEMLKDKEFSQLLKAFESFKKGSIGPGHVDRKGHPSPLTSLSVRGANASPQGDGSSTRDRQPPEAEIKGHHPLTVVGPKGVRRTIVRSNSLGLELIHDAMAGSSNLWVLDNETGSMRINVLHPLWNQCEEHSDKTLMRFQEFLILQALVLQSAPKDWSEFARLVMDDLNSPFVFLLVNADRIAGRGPGRHSSKSEGKVIGKIQSAKKPKASARRRRANT